MCIGRILDLLEFAQQIEHTLHVGKRVFDLTIDKTEKVHGDEHTRQVHDYHGQVAEGEIATHDAMPGQHNHAGGADGDDGTLTDIQC